MQNQTSFEIYGWCLCIYEAKIYKRKVGMYYHSVFLSAFQAWRYQQDIRGYHCCCCHLSQKACISSCSGRKGLHIACLETNPSAGGIWHKTGNECSKREMKINLQKKNLFFFLFSHLDESTFAIPSNWRAKLLLGETPIIWNLMKLNKDK